MPEGPETWRDARRLDAALAGRPAQEVWFAFEHLEPDANVLRGSPVGAVEARGKAILVSFPEVERVIVTHNNLYGRWYLVDAGERPDTRRQLRLLLENDRKAALLYSASDIRVLPADGLDDHPYLGRIGPDALAPETTVADLRQRLSERRFSGRALCGLLLDQSFVAGLGNYLRSEILFEAGVHPDDRPKDLAPPLLDALADALSAVPRRALAERGRTVTDDLVAPDAKDPPKPGSRRPPRRPRHHVFARAGRPCPRCGSRIRREDAGGRRVYRCPRCQPPHR